MLLNIPNAVGMVEILVGRNLMLIVAPLRQLSTGEAECSVCCYVHQSDLRLYGMPVDAFVLLVEDLDAPQQLTRHGDVVVDVAGDFL